MKRCFVIFAVALSLVSASVVDAQNFWEPTGLANLSVDALAINENGQIFAGMGSGGIFRSTNNGNSWTQVFGSQNKGWVKTLSINANGHIFAGLFYGYVFRSTNNGDSWTEVLSVPEVNVYCLSINSSGHVFVGTDDGGGVYRSTDDGDSWTQIATGLTDRSVESLAINANGHIFAGVFGRGVYRSTNNGDSWALVNGDPNDDINSIVIDPSGHIFVGTRYFGVYWTTDNGNSWEQINGGLPDVTKGGDCILAISPNGYMFAGTDEGVFRSVQPITVVRGTSGHECRQHYFCSSKTTRTHLIRKLKFAFSFPKPAMSCYESPTLLVR